MENIRLGEIMSMVRRDGKVTTDSIAERFGVTVQTARRDLGTLCDTGQLTRVYGGAVLPSGTRNVRHDDRQTLNAVAKAGIAAVLADRIPDGASVFIDIGTSLEAVARALSEHRNLMVVTNNLHAASSLAQTDEIEVIVAGGVLRSSDGGLVGESAAEFLRQFRTDFALFGASALSQSGDALDYDYREVKVAQTVMSLARQSVLVADHSKFNRSAPVRIAAISDFDMFVTDTQPPEGIAEECQLHGCEILIGTGR